MTIDHTNKLQAPTIGTPFEGGFFGGQIRIGGAIFAVIWAPKAFGESKGIWRRGPTMLLGAISCCDSMGNTKDMADAGSPLAKWALALEINGYKDWCIPARDVLELGYRHLKPTIERTCGTPRDGDNPSSLPPGYPYASNDPVTQTTIDVFKAGNSEAFYDYLYWSSTSYSNNSAWNQNFGHGSQDLDGQGYEFCARAVRLIAWEGRINEG